MLALAHTLLGLVLQHPVRRVAPEHHRSLPPRALATPRRLPSLLTEMWEKLSWPLGGEAVFYEMRDEMVDAFAGVAGDADSAEIDLAQFTALLSQLGDDLPAEKLRQMFESVDTNFDGRIEYVKFYKACLDEARSMKQKRGRAPSSYGTTTATSADWRARVAAQPDRTNER